jgi:hypothetical protein
MTAQYGFNKAADSLLKYDEKHSRHVKATEVHYRPYLKIKPIV